MLKILKDTNLVKNGTKFKIKYSNRILLINFIVKLKIFNIRIYEI